MGIFEESRCIRLQMQGIRFNHLDRTNRYQQIASVLHSSNASLSFPNLFKDQHQLKGFYRLINNKFVSHSTFISGYQSGLIKYSLEHEELTPWILVQDTMLTNFRTRKVLDLGYTQTERSNGLILHHGLMLNDAFMPLGLLHQQVIHRERETYKQARSAEDKETKKWVEALHTGAEFSRQTGRALIHLMDREADVAGIINAANDLDKQYFVIRAAQNRILTDENGKSLSAKLFNSLPSLNRGETIQRQLTNDQGKTYLATCMISYGQLNIKSINQPVNCVWVKEIQPEETKEERELAEWLLLTNLSFEAYTAEVIAELYSRRWVIEDFHKCYKTGCSIEKRQFDSRKTLTTALGLLAITAIILLRSRYFAKDGHDIPFETIVTDKAEQLLARKIADKYLKPVDKLLCKPNTVLWWLLLLGRMGGHQGFNQKGLPGWQTLWRGYTFFQSMLIGFNYANSPP